MPQEGLRAELRRCVLCDGCDRLHGLEREAAIMSLRSFGRIDTWFAIGQMMIDDAHHAGALFVRGPQFAAELWIPRPICRWEVVIGRAIARQEIPDVGEMVAAVLNRYVPGPRSAIPALAAELKDALCTVDDDVLDVVVSCDADALDPAHLLVNITHRTATGPTITLCSAVEIPDDIATRPRGQA